MIQAPVSSRYECLVKVASGGMATVYVGRLRGKHGFSRLVAIKRAHAHLLEDESQRRGLIREARLVAQIHDPHVVSVLDVDEPNGELMLVMDYIEGGSLSQLLASAGKRGELLPPGVVVRILLDSCAGLAAAHELRDAAGAPLSIVHRDVSPHNILVGVDGLSRITDFGIAKWADATHATSAGLKGKFSYMAPEYIETRKVDQRADVFALGVVAWEAFTGTRLFRSDDELQTIQRVVSSLPARVSSVAPSVPAEFDAPIARALEKDPNDRFASARDLGRALELAAERAGLDLGGSHVAATVRHLVGDVLEARRTRLRELGESRGAETGGGSTDAASCAEGVRTATATLDAAFATDARTLPIERGAKHGAVLELGVPPKLGVANKASLSVRNSLALGAATALGVLLIVLASSSKGPAPSAKSTDDPAASKEADTSVLADEADASPASLSEPLVAAEAPPSLTVEPTRIFTATASLPVAPGRKSAASPVSSGALATGPLPPRPPLATRAPSTTPSAAPPAPSPPVPPSAGPSTPTRPGLGY